MCSYPLIVFVWVFMFGVFFKKIIDLTINKCLIFQHSPGSYLETKWLMNGMITLWFMFLNLDILNVIVNADFAYCYVPCVCMYVHVHINIFICAYKYECACAYICVGVQMWGWLCLPEFLCFPQFLFCFDMSGWRLNPALENAKKHLT